MEYVIDIRNEETNCLIVFSLKEYNERGYEEFRVHSCFWKPKENRFDKNLIEYGFCKSRILNLFPQFKTLIDLHVHELRGYPHKYIEKGFYHIKNASKEDFVEWYRVTEQEYDLLKLSDTEEEFTWLLIAYLKNHEKWQKLASEGIKMLEELTGQSFESKAVSLPNIMFLDGKDTDKYNIEYFNIENVEARRKEKQEREKQEAIKKVKDFFNKEINLLEVERDFKVQLIELGYRDFDNIAFYRGKKEFILNNRKNHIHIFTEADFKIIKENIKLPQGVSIEFNEIKR